MKSIVTIGGGTGQFGLLSGLKKYPVRLSAIVSMADDGGSTGKLRDELGVLPPGDIRQCLVALSNSDKVMRDLFSYRFGDKGGLQGHSFGNLFLSALEKVTGSFDEAVETAAKVLNICGEVVPVTSESVHLVGYGKKGKMQGEHAIDLSEGFDTKSLRLEPMPSANPRALRAICNADCIVIGPGDIFTSIVPNLLVPGISEAIKESKAKVIYNCNLVTKPGHTDGYTVSDFVAEIEHYLGEGRIDHITYNDVFREGHVLDRYTAASEHPVEASLTELDKKRSYCGDFLAGTIVQKIKGDAIARSFIRHDSDKLAKAIVEHCMGWHLEKIQSV